MKPVSVSPIHYNQVPNCCFGKSILDVGCASGLNALLSKHRAKFLLAEQQGEYIGLDIIPQPKRYLEPIVCDDILTAILPQQFDLVLCLHVVEHIQFEKWHQLFDALKQYVAPGGYLVVGTPYDDPPEIHYNHDHVVFHIRPETLMPFLPGAQIRKVRRRYINFRNSNESLLWAIGRFFYRILTRHFYRYRLLGNYEVVAIWRKESGSNYIRFLVRQDMEKKEAENR